MAEAVRREYFGPEGTGLVRPPLPHFPPEPEPFPPPRAEPWAFFGSGSGDKSSASPRACGARLELGTSAVPRRSHAADRELNSARAS